jgi:hypothetical protein
VKGLLAVTKKVPAITSASPATNVGKGASTRVNTGKHVASPFLWFCFILVIALGLVTVSFVNATIANWLVAPHISGNAADASSFPITTLSVQRTSQYAGLQVTIVNAQRASAFPDDPIRPGKAFVRLNLRVMNPRNVQFTILYYDSARLLIPQQLPIAPTNTNLATSTSLGKSQVGWLDFPVPENSDLRTLALRLGSVSLDEMMVTIPLTGPFDPHHFAARSFPQSLDISYAFSGNQLTYRLKQVDLLYSYQGNQVKAGQQYYTLKFLVDNPHEAVSPGPGFDYIRLIVNGYSQPPLDSTLPSTFKAGTHATAGDVVFAAPARMRTITIAFRAQMGNAQQAYTVDL